MISIKRLGSASEAGSYYSEAGYYTKDGVSLASEWGGGGSEALGLQGQTVDIDRFTDVLNGQIDDLTQLGRSDGKGGIQHAPGHDFTFSAPKGVSIAALVGGDERLIEAHHAAVRAAMKYLESKAVARVNGEKIFTNNLLYTMFTHTTSRANDPQLHTHVPTANATMHEGNWYSLETSDMYKAKMNCGLVYRSFLASQLKPLGYEVEITDAEKGFFDIVEVPTAVKDGFSKRRKEIEQAAADRDITTQKGMEVVTVMSRDSKKNLSPEELWASWEKTTDDFGFDINGVVDSARDKAKQIFESTPPEFITPELDNGDIPIPGVNQQAVRDARLAYRTLAADEAVFDMDTLTRNMLKLGMGSYSPDDAVEAIHAIIANKEILIRPHGLTTPDAIRTEAYIVSSMLNMKGTKEAIATNREMVIDHIKAYEQAQSEKFNLDFTLRPGQRRSIETILLSRDAITGIQGLAGTGKTTAVNVIKSVAHAQNYKVIGLAQSGSAAETLHKETGIETFTLDSFIFRAKKQRESNGERYAGNEIWLVDEASLANARNFADLITEARRSGARIVFQGDKEQHESIEWGKVFYLLQAHGMKTALMDDITRQRESPELLNAVKAAYRGDLAGTFTLLGDNVKESKSPLDDIIQKHNELSAQERKESIFIIPSNEARRDFNLAARKHLKEEGQINTDDLNVAIFTRTNLNYEELKDVRFYQRQKVQAIEFHQDMEAFGIRSGDRFKLNLAKSDVGKNTLYLEHMENGKAVEFSLFSLAGTASKQVIDAYRLDQIPVSVGETLTWKKTRKDLGLMNGDELAVKSIDQANNKLMVEHLKTGKEMTLDAAYHQDLDYSYAVTSQTSQGMTKRYAYALMHSANRFLTNARALLVNISRASLKAELYVDSTKAVIKTIEKADANKTIATSHVTTDGMKQHARYIKAHEADISQLAAADLTKAMNNLAAKKGVFSVDELKRETLRWSLGRYSPDDIDRHIHKARELKELTLIHPGEGENAMLAMAQTIKDEAALTRQVQSGVGRRSRIMSDSKIERYIAAHNETAADKQTIAIQSHDKEVLLHLFDSKDEIRFLSCFAEDGTAKMLRTAGAKMLEGAGYRVRAFAVSNKTLTQQNDAGLKATNIYGWIQRLSERAVNRQQTNNSKDVWLIEDSALLDAKSIMNISLYARMTGARVVFVGNEKENSMGWGNTMELLKSQGLAVVASQGKHLATDERVSDAAKAFRSGRIKDALTAIEKMMVEIDHGDKKLANQMRQDVIEHSYFSTPAAERDLLDIIIPDRKTGDIITDRLREGLRKEGVISGDVLTTLAERAVFMTDIERTDARSYKEGFTIRSKRLHGEYLVISVNKETNQLTLQDKRQEGGAMVVSGSDLKDAETYQPHEVRLAIGDKIRLTKQLPKELLISPAPNENRGVRNKETGRITNIDPATQQLTIQFDSGRQATIKPESFRHIEHAYVKNGYDFKTMAQPKDKPKNVVMLLESNKLHSLTQEQMHGILSHTTGQLRIVTDSARKSLDVLDNSPGFRRSALALKQTKVSRGVDRQSFEKQFGALMGVSDRKQVQLAERIAAGIENIKAKYQIGRQRERSL